MFGHIEIGENFSRELGKLTLILYRLGETRQSPPVEFQILPPKIHHMGCSNRRRGARQPFAHKQRQHIFQRRIGALADLCVMASLVFVFQSRRQILCDFSLLGPDGFHARPFHGVEHGARC